MTKIRSLFMNPSREEWALALAEYFFSPKKIRSRIRIDVDKSVLQRIISKNNWDISDPVLSISQCLPQGDDAKNDLFFRGKNDYLDIHSGYYNEFPKGIVDFSLGMIVANEHFSSANAWSQEFNSLLNLDSSSSIFSQNKSTCSINLRNLLHSLQAWCEKKQIRIPELLPHSNLDCQFNDCKCKWGGWGYIGKFYDHLEITDDDKKLFLKWINKTLDDNIGIEYEDLVNDRRDLMIRSLFYFEDQLSPRLKIWLNSGGELNDKFWSIVKNYLLYLISLRNNRFNHITNNKEIFEDYELSQIREKKNKVRPLISVDYEDDWGLIKYEKLNYYLEEIDSDSTISIPGFSEGYNLPLTDKIAMEALRVSSISIDRMEVLQNKTSLYPICVLIEEDLTLKSRYMLEDSDNAVSAGDNFSLLCFGSQALESGLDIARRLSDSANLDYSEDFLMISQHKTSSNKISYTEKNIFHQTHKSSLFIIPELTRNWENVRNNDPRELISSSSEKSLIGIRHRSNSPIFHEFSGHPELKINPSKGCTIHELAEIHPIPNHPNQYKIIQKIINSSNIEEKKEMIYEFRAILKEEMSVNNLISEYDADKNNVFEIIPNSKMLDNYFQSSESAKIKIIENAKEHSGRIFLNDRLSLIELIDSEHSFPKGSENRELWESRLKSTLGNSTLDLISNILPKLESEYFQNNPKLIKKLIQKRLAEGKLPKSLATLQILNNYTKSGTGSENRYNDYITNIKNHNKNNLFKELEWELNRFETVPAEIVDEINKLYSINTEEFGNKISKFKVMNMVGVNNPEDKMKAVFSLLDSLSPKPWKIIDADYLNPGLSIIIENLSTDSKTDRNSEIEYVKEWINKYNEIKDSIINFNLLQLKEVRDLSINPGTLWVYVSRQMKDESWFSEWNNSEKAREFRIYLNGRINSLSMNDVEKRKLQERFLKIMKILIFRDKITSMEGSGEE